jgi:hypothetical protein
VVATYGRAGTLSNVDEGWWLNERTWRSKTLVDHQSGSRGTGLSDNRYGTFTGAGSFTVMAHGIEMVYDAHDHIFAREVDAEQDAGPVDDLLGYLENIDYSPAHCPIVGHERIAGRETDHRRCRGDELWIDAATGLTLRSRLNGHDVLVVRSIEYHPDFPAGIFRFIPPPGSHDLAQLEKNLFYKTKLAPGKPAPNLAGNHPRRQTLPAHRPARQTRAPAAAPRPVRRRPRLQRPGAARAGIPEVKPQDAGGLGHGLRGNGPGSAEARAARPAHLPRRLR